jgi:hypothetical protein
MSEIFAQRLAEQFQIPDTASARSHSDEQKVWIDVEDNSTYLSSYLAWV